MTDQFEQAGAVADELDPFDIHDAVLLAAMRAKSRPVADGVLADIYDRKVWLEIRAVLADEPRVPGAVGLWLDTLPRHRKVMVPAVVSRRLTGMLERRGFRRVTWFDPRIGSWDTQAMGREPEQIDPKSLQ